MRKISEALGKHIEELQATSSMTDPERGLEEGHKAGIRNQVDGFLTPSFGITCYALVERWPRRDFL